MQKYSTKVLNEFLECEPPHLALVRAYEAEYYAKYLPFKGKILDVGCGDGFFAWSVYNQQIINEGIDVKGSLWQEAKLKGNYKNVQEYNGDDIPFKDDEFDTVVSNCVLEHVPGAENLIKEMARVTKRNGLVLVTVVTDKFGDNLMGTRIFGPVYKNWFNRKSIHVSPYSKDKWLQIFKDNGLKVIDTEEYINSKELIAWHDISHYWGIPNLISRKITGRWVWGPGSFSNKMWKIVFEIISQKKQTMVESPYLFVAARKS